MLHPPKLTEDKMNPDCYNQNKMEKPPVVSSRRGRNFLLHNLEESDVIFGTKGNGRNEIFLKVLESHSEQYVQLSKFQKMGLIQKIIRDWKGNFYIMNSKTNDLCLAKKKDQDLSTTDPSSRKLYTSVRRMMNYVNSKIQRQPCHPSRSECTGSSVMIHTTSTTESMVPTPRINASRPILTNKDHEPKSRKNPVPHAKIANLAAQKKQPTVMTATNYIRKNQITLPIPETIFLENFPRTSTSMTISSPKRSSILVTPEPSPRVFLQNSPQISPIPFLKPVLSQNNTTLIVPCLPISPSSSATISRKNDMKNSYSKQQATPTILTARNKMIKNYLHAADNTIGDLEESAILTLTSLGYSSSIMSS